MKQTQTELNINEYYNPIHIMGQTVWKKEKEPPEYESINENTEEDELLIKEEQLQQTEQEIKDLQGTAKSLRKEITAHHSLLKN